MATVGVHLREITTSTKEVIPGICHLVSPLAISDKEVAIKSLTIDVIWIWKPDLAII